MISAGDIKKGITLELDGTLYTILDFQHIKMGRGSAQVRLRLKDIKAGHIIERTFQAGEKFARARLDRRSAQYLYQDGDLFYFMDTDTFEQRALGASQLEESMPYLKDGFVLDILLYDEEPIGVELPNTVELLVTETGPSFRGDTAQGGNKPAVMETGVTIQVPLFINTGDTVRVDTRSGQYLERV